MMWHVYLIWAYYMFAMHVCIMVAKLLFVEQTELL